MKPVLVTAVLIGALGSGAQATQVYFNDFDSGVGLGGTGAIVNAQGYDGINGISGNFWFNDSFSERSTLRLRELNAHNVMTLSFDIAFIDSWDGNIGRIYGDDFFNILIDGVTHLITTNFGGIGDELSDKSLGYYGFTERHDDEAYRYSATFAHSASEASLSFFADGVKWQAGADESWAIDNLSIAIGTNVIATPIPASLPLLAGALALFAAVGRRRKG